MSRKLLPTLFFVALVGVAWIATLGTASSIEASPKIDNHESSYTFAVQNGYYRSDHSLFVSLPPSLRAYYAGKSHNVNNEKDYAKFITPEAVQSVADNIRNLTRDTPYNDEEFANAVLMIVRGITYVRSSAKYPVETIVDNEADCDGLSILAASIMKAGGLDVVLLLYKGVNPTHMNIGVSLEQMPVSHSWWVVPSGIDYHDKTYWVAECTSLADWSVGDRPELLTKDKPYVISLANCEQNAPGHVSSSLNGKMEQSSISIDLSTGLVSNASSEVHGIRVSGAISPALSNQTVAFYATQPGYSPSALMALTDEEGEYIIQWNLTLPGTYNLKASWSGSSNKSASDSETLTVFVDARQSPIGVLPSYFWGEPTDAQSRAYSPSFLALLNQGSKEFLKANLTGRDVVLSGEFMVLSDGSELLYNDTTLTIPSYQRVYRLPRSRQSVLVQVPEETISLHGIEQWNCQFGFVIERVADDNYTASVRLIANDAASEITQADDSTLFINASEVAGKNAWNKAIAKMSSETRTVEVYSKDGSRLGNKTALVTGEDFEEVAVLMTYIPGQVIAFKNLKVETSSQSAYPIDPEREQESGLDFLIPYVRISLLLAGATMAVVTFKGRRKFSKSSSSLHQYSKDNSLA